MNTYEIGTSFPKSGTKQESSLWAPASKSERSVDSESPLFSVMQCTAHLSLNKGNLKSRFGEHSAGVLIQASNIHH